ncbi:MAG TPA: prepilin-type N-terminal cleavage/methylation domain-containing protein [Methylophilaceae bacterium]|nr:prepilin-type N-terminal cleavage/methylation domain-containing protein [Methylophilaceae bacterium]
MLKENSQRGFSLVEMAVVVVILGLVLGALLLPLQAQRNQVFQTQTETTMETARRALLGFAQANGRLPCPAIAISSGLEDPIGGGICTAKLGFLPAATLGIRPTDDNGFAIDGWNNRIMYAVAQHNAGGAVTPDYTTPGDMNTVGIAALQPELRVCLSSSGVTAAACSGGTESNYAINNAVAVVYSLGSTGSLGSGGNDEDENPSAPGTDSVFVSHDVTAAGTADGEFDHVFTWISPYVLYNAMIQAGQLH